MKMTEKIFRILLLGVVVLFILKLLFIPPHYFIGKVIYLFSYCTLGSYVIYTGFQKKYLWLKILGFLLVILGVFDFFF